MKNLLEKQNVKGKIKTSVICIIWVFAFAIVMSIVGTAVSSSQFRSFYTELHKCSLLQMEIRKDMQYLGKNLMWAITHSDPVEIETREKLAAETLETLKENIAKFDSVYHNENQLEKLNTTWETFMDTHEQLLEYMASGDKKTSIFFYVGDYETIVAELQNLFIEISEEIESEADRAYNTSNNTSIGSTILQVILLVVSICVGLYFVKQLAEMITKPVLEVKHTAEMIAKGQLDVEIEYESSDELGDLADSFREMCVNFKNIINDLSYLLHELKEGNFNVESNNIEYYVGDFAKIIADLKQTAIKQSDTLLAINRAVSQIAVGSEQLAQSAQDIAAGANNQAADVENLSTTLSNVISISDNSTSKAENAIDTVKDAVSKAETGKTEVEELINAMNRISETSNEIGNIIADIEDIANQTNLLSLNASIEAARAGEAGRGFAVVAEQIGKLASSSAQSVVGTRDLIQKALVEIENGCKIVDNTTKIITNTIEDMENFENIANGMVKAFKAQSEMLKQVEVSVDQISGVVQSNAAVAEETSAVSEELSAQAAALNELSGQFTFRV